MVKGLTIFILLVAVIGCGEPPLEIPVEVWDYQKTATKVEPGDIVLKQGHGLISEKIVDVMDEDLPFSHCAIVVADSINTFSVIHSVSGQIAAEDGVQTIPLQEMYKDVVEGTLFVLRHKSSSEERIQIAERARQKLAQRIRFDHDFNSSDTSQLYCSEMVHQVLKEVYNKEYFQTKTIGLTPVYSFNSILESPDFEILNRAKAGTSQ